MWVRLCVCANVGFQTGKTLKNVAKKPTVYDRQFHVALAADDEVYRNVMPLMSWMQLNVLNLEVFSNKAIRVNIKPES